MRTLRLLTPVLARIAIVSCAAVAVLSQAGELPIVRIATSDQGDWNAFEAYLNQSLQNDCQIKLVARDPEQSLYDLMHSTGADGVQGAILPPFRYVVADLWIDKLTLVARIRRGGVVPSDAEPAQASPLPNYRSVVLMRRNASYRWPPANAGNPIGVSISDYRSSSEYVFPFAYFSDNGLFARRDLQAKKDLPDLVKASPRNSSVQNTQDAWQLPKTRPSTSISREQDIQEQIKKVKEGRETDPILSISDHKLNSSVPNAEERGKAFRELFRSAAIPFDALVIRESDSVPPKMITAIRRAFLSTGSMLEQQRNECFKWTPVAQAPPVPSASPAGSPSQYWQRHPDIYDFVEARDGNYDGVRAAAAKAFRGRIVHIAASRRVHRDEDNDLDYFRRWMKYLLRETVTTTPVFIDVKLRDNDDHILEELEDGRLQAAELNAATAARGIGRKSVALIGKAIFDGSAKYSFVMLAAKGVPADPNGIDDRLKFAYTSEDSSSGYRYPVTVLKKLGKSPSQSSWIKGVEAEGVVNLLLNKAEDKKQTSADYGFLASFEWEGIQNGWSHPELNNIKKVNLDADLVEIPNAYLVLSRASAPEIDRLGLRANISEKPFSSVRHSSSVAPTLDSATVDSLRKNLYQETWAQGFQGYIRPLDEDAEALVGFYHRFEKDPFRAGIIILVAVVLCLAAGLVYSIKAHGQAQQTELSIQSLWDVLKGVPPQDRTAQQTVTLATKQISALRHSTALFTRIFKEPRMRELQTSLESSLLGLLAFHNPKRSTVPDGTYSTALGQLEAATAEADEEFQQIIDAVSGLPQSSQQEVAPDLTAIKTAIEIAKSIVDLTRMG